MKTNFSKSFWVTGQAILNLLGFCSFAWQATTDSTNVEHDAEQLLFKTLISLDKGLDFMMDQVININLDGVIGTRMASDQLQVLIKHIDNGEYPNVSNDVNTHIREIIRKASDVSDIAIEFLKYTEKEYYERIGRIIQKGFWLHDYPNRVTDPSLITEPKYEDESMKEKDSDDCLTELVGTNGHNKCEMSNHCWNLMTAPGYRFYSLSHEVFYMQIGEAAGCFYGKFLEITDPLVTQWCTNMLQEAEAIEMAGYPEKRRDLFMEQQVLCGISGFQDFFRDNWLEKILEWQWPEGCWGDHKLAPYASNTYGPEKRRVKREERILEGGCEAHRTAVALGALGQYVRYIMDFIYKQPAQL